VGLTGVRTHVLAQVAGEVQGFIERKTLGGSGRGFTGVRAHVPAQIW